MAKSNSTPYRKVVFTHHTFVRREHIAGGTMAQPGESLVIIVAKGEEKVLLTHVANDLHVQDAVVWAENRDAVDAIRESAKEDAEKQAARVKEKKAFKVETFDDKIVRIASVIGGQIAAALTGKKTAAA